MNLLKIKYSTLPLIKGSHEILFYQYFQPSPPSLPKSACEPLLLAGAVKKPLSELELEVWLAAPCDYSVMF
jgi:hypothetical protein